MLSAACEAATTHDALPSSWRPLAAAQGDFDVAGHVDEARPDLVFQLLAREMKRRRAAVECEHTVWRTQRHADCIDVALPVAEREREAARFEILDGLFDRRL